MTASAVHLLKRLLEVALPDGLLCFSRIFARLLRLAEPDAATVAFFADGYEKLRARR